MAEVGHVHRSDLDELQYIVPIRNLGSIARHGILSHTRAQGVRHESVADPNVQEIRSRKRLPSGRMLHEYANLYINARNAMLYRRCREGKARGLCVLRVHRQAMDVLGAYVTDENAAREGAEFVEAPAGLAIVDKDATFARGWGGDSSESARAARSKTMAEVLVPDSVPPSLVTGSYAGNSRARARLIDAWPSLDVTVVPDMFFGFTGEGA
ncbi:MAG: DUF4433 domain-containing protein [Chloroflexota bacterium]|nr:DUF4433 domain-containing protein [Chloroflexota bacterium]